ncbi:TIGR02444 family protein [Pseudomonas sp. PA27(2017)]|uniref:TIGR02444 family protein n=1 Tax=Pseudomonas sp. PA27(2017) TaxID=1932112 RepID=UPI00095A57AE|nr:TIGR02444 family protein [Pseudomonas sp. PA27(2017)]OLU34545.1 TIGR02444 family protein [Pseudomonas sp. PA27(2017)]
MSPDLWTFATTLYARPGVEAACLELQAAGADVCLLLCGLWLDSRGVAHDAEREAQLRQAAEQWQREVVKPLRALRQGWREAAGHDSALSGLRERVKQLELEAEREQLERLQALAEGWSQQPSEQDRRWLEAFSPAGHAEACAGLRSASLL